MSYHDCLNRPVNIGDIILFTDNRGVLEDSCILMVGNEVFSSRIVVSKTEYLCYKINSQEAFNLYNNYHNFNLHKYSQDNIFIYEYPDKNYSKVYTKKTLDILGRDLKLGDLVIWFLRKSKPCYGIQIGHHKIFTEDGLEKDVNYVFKLENPIPEEIDIKNKLMQLYQNKELDDLYIKTKSKEHDKSDINIGDVYRTRFSEYGYLYIGNVYLDITIPNTSPIYTSPILHNMCIEFKIGKSTKVFMDKVISNSVCENDIKKITAIKSYCYDAVLPYWDSVDLANATSLLGYEPSVSRSLVLNSKNLINNFKKCTLDYLSSRFITKDDFTHLDYIGSIKIEPDIKINSKVHVNGCPDSINCTVHLNV